MSKREEELAKELVGIHADRLGVPKDKAWENAMKFSQAVGKMENEGKLVGKNPLSSAKGLYQFIDGSLAPAVQRVTKYVPKEEWMDSNVNDMDKEQQTLLFLGDILEKTAVVQGTKVPGLGDEILREVLSTGDKDAQALAYEVLHHTNVDEATRDRMRMIWNLEQ